MFVLFITSAPAVIAPVVQDLISLEYVTLTILTPPPPYIYIYIYIYIFLIVVS